MGAVETPFLKGREAASEKETNTFSRGCEEPKAWEGGGRLPGLGALKKKRGFRVTEAEVQGPLQEPILALPSPD